MASEHHSAFELLCVARRAQARQLVMHGAQWLVYEMPAAQFDRRRSPSLVFESDDTVRRVRSFPPGWRKLSDAELATLSWSR